MCCCIQVKEFWKEIEISLEDSLEILFMNVPFVPMDLLFHSYNSDLNLRAKWSVVSMLPANLHFFSKWE